MIINKPSLDYVRLTSFTFREYQGVVWKITPSGDSGERAGWKQYKGTRYGNIFHGQGEQGGKTHYLIDVSGQAAEEHRGELLRNRMRVRRVDIQVTIPLPVDYASRELTDALRYGRWPGRERGVLLYDNAGEDTVYIGSRSSDRFIRVYVKELGYLRFEVEFSKDRAERAAQMVREGGQNALNGILYSELSTLPDAPYMGEFRQVLDDLGAKKWNVKVIDTKSEQIKRLRWLASLMPTIRKMMYDHDYGHVVSDWIINLANERLKDAEEIFVE